MTLELNIFTVKNFAKCKVSLPGTATIFDVKKEIAKKDDKLSVERQSLRTDIKGKDVDNKTTLSSLDLRNGSTLYIKDLGPQIGYRTVYILEYLGPPIVYALLAYRPSFIYNNRDTPMTLAAQLALVFWIFHYVKRLYESAFVHRFSHGTMPFKNLYRNCLYYWGFAGYVAIHINHPLFSAPPIWQVMLGAIIFVVSELGNLSIHLLLRDLRPAGSTIRKIPVPTDNPFTKIYSLVSCPNYTYEFTAWLGFFILTSCLPVLIFATAGMYQMTVWALNKHKAYKKEFKDYPRRTAIIPYIL